MQNQQKQKVILTPASQRKTPNNRVSLPEQCLPEQWLAEHVSHSPDTIQLGLERVNCVAERLGLIHFDCPVILLGGTNGKGSTVAFLESIYSSAGYSVGSYTSPHLVHFNERIRINQQPVDNHKICSSLNFIRQAAGEIKLTYFEYTTLAALRLFQGAQCDVLLLEVGLGGRLDAVNVVEPDCAVITSVALDHMEYLGPNREAIGFEKAGIFRANKPAIVADQSVPRSVLQQAERLNVRLSLIKQSVDGQTPKCHFYEYHIDEKHWDWSGQSHALFQLPLPALSIHNAATALSVIEQMDDTLPVDERFIRKGISETALQGRHQLVQDGCQVILDVAHNPAACQHLARQLEDAAHTGKTYAIFSILENKDIEGSVKVMRLLIDAWHVCPLPQARGADLHKIVQIIEDLEIDQCYTHASVESAYECVRAEAGPQDRIVVFGSFYTVAALLPRWTFEQSRSGG